MFAGYVMDFLPTDHPEVLIVRPRVFADGRGTFSEVFNRQVWQAQGMSVDFCQDNQVLSHAAGTVRGMHFQRPPHAQAKLVRVVRGAILDVAVDVRTGSPRFGQMVACTLSAENGEQLFVPAGFAHGYCTLVPDTEVIYKVDAHYAPDAEGGLFWDDPDLGIPWPAVANPETVLERDRTLPLLKDLPPSFP